MSFTEKEINDLVKELNIAIIESVDAQSLEDEGKKAIIKARKRLQMARAAINEIKFN